MQGLSYTQLINRILTRWDSNRHIEALNAWDLSRHDVFNEDKRPKRKVTLVDYEKKDKKGNPIMRKELEEVNRIGLALEQDITNIHTSFCVGLAPDLRAKASDADASKALDVLSEIDEENRLYHKNKQIVRSWLSECIVAEYWYTVASDEGYSEGYTTRLKCDVWSPFQGDILIPIHSSDGKLIRFIRRYSLNREERKLERLMDIDENRVRVAELQNKEWVIISEATHGLDKLPVVYMSRPKPLCHSISGIRNRLEMLMSNYADCVDYNFAPKIVAKGGKISGIWKQGSSQIVHLQGENSSLHYLTWNQSPENIKMELDRLYDQAYQITNTPRISLQDMQGLGSSFSGASFRYVFMGAHMAVRNHEEVIGEYLSRRYSLLLTAISKVSNIKTNKLRLNPTLVPYEIEANQEKKSETNNDNN